MRGFRNRAKTRRPLDPSQLQAAPLALRLQPKLSFQLGDFGAHPPYVQGSGYADAGVLRAFDCFSSVPLSRRSAGLLWWGAIRWSGRVADSEFISKHYDLLF